MATTWQQSYAKLLREIATLAWQSYMRNPSQTLYVVGRFDGAVWRGVTVGDEESWAELVISDPLPRSLDIDGLVAWLRERMGRTPLAIVAAA